MKLAALPDRAVLEISGEDRVAFLQGLISNDVTKARADQALWAALLTPQGKWLADFFVIATPEALLLDVEAAQLAMLIQRLSRFKLRARVALRDASADWRVHAAWGEGAPPEGLAARDPRLPEAGWRLLAGTGLPSNASPADYAAHRLALGLPDGSKDMEAEKSVLLEGGFDELNGISWTKGCYMGQELTARTRYRGLLKRRLVPVAIDGPAPERGTPILAADGAEAGEMRSSQGAQGLALLRLEWLGKGALTAGGARLTPQLPSWMKLPEDKP
ncbi:MAG: folate-binding protein YgfZ [Roseomonas sp.]|nr:folate-binding protein YgfZ [Roseomonas sp.]MCA3327197.1 folate-binding protein YgfZ [Roseomonas sp.]MCA3330086.1 folate-binding protein YgfZ [Roseomonas sp.]MCA3333748.1 folate-binding protein YgfZ [Roseomonas sp.]MCA3346842.1 folate-binding protein YgfZ [Roseomonas sp.]